jgi:hypothetical protein
MAEVIHCRPEDLGDVLSEDLERHVESERRMLTRRLTHIQVEMVAEAPRLEGDFAASIRPYVGEPGPTWKRGGGGSDAGAAEVESTMADWTPGQNVGIATDAPQSRKLIFHAGDQTGKTYKSTSRRRRVREGQARKTFTKKVDAGWVERIVDEANRLTESE